MHPAKTTSFAADDYLSKHVVAAEGSGLSVWACVHNTAADKLFPHLHENFTRDDGFMAVLYIVLRNDTIVLDPFLLENQPCRFFCKRASPMYFSFRRILLMLLVCHLSFPAPFKIRRSLTHDNRFKRVEFYVQLF